MTGVDLEAQHAALDAEYDATYSHEETPEVEARRARLLWAMVQVDMALGADYGEDDIAEYRRAAEGRT